MALLFAGALFAAAGACSSDDDDGTSTSSSSSTTSSSSTSSSAGGGGSGGDNSTGGGGSAPVGGGCTEPTEVACSDNVLQDLNLQDDTDAGMITSTPEGMGFLSLIDAVAGGAMATDPTSYTYGRFTDTGLEKVNISDEAALDSMEWDIAFRRSTVRINSGNSGPSCVTGAPIPNAVFDEVTAVPDPAPAARTDSYYSSGCVLQGDASGQPTAPGTALSGFYVYNLDTHCVGMSDQVYLLQLADSRYLKLEITAYYTTENQQLCDNGDPLPQGPTGSGNYQVRWAFLP
ncbi:HmuY family protein [Chondromyces apiculatus]|uniref:Lipoprotein n=1 Tax=Chondromyces apiculatus DSM 436 TaxID=1192034 RepID=A0A017TAC7_9BACT|nr:HmuY family protein [Chondromyces apiculatus]EYF06184.1 Hypothetical protein CAP_2062 [Chondromyces apiculatus DSM 436]